MKTLNPYKNYCPYDVGDLLYTKNPKLPKDRWPGTQWAPIYTFVYGNTNKQTVGATGGAETVALTKDQMPSHTHNWSAWAPRSGNLPDTQTYKGLGGFTGTSWYITKGSNIEYEGGSGIDFTGGGQAHNNLPPYTTAYIWERTA